MAAQINKYKSSTLFSRRSNKTTTRRHKKFTILEFIYLFKYSRRVWAERKTSLWRILFALFVEYLSFISRVYFCTLIGRRECRQTPESAKRDFLLSVTFKQATFA